MTIDDVVSVVGDATTDQSGHLGSFTFRKSGVLAYIEARLDKSAGTSPALWNIVWTTHWRSDRGQEQRDSSTDLKSLLTRFGPIDIESTPASSLDEL